jgi:hypothetical protein
LLDDRDVDEGGRTFLPQRKRRIRHPDIFIDVIDKMNFPS